VASATEAQTIADSIGAGFHADAARNVVSVALTEAAAWGRLDAVVVVREVRSVIEDQLHNNTRVLAVGHLGALAVLIAPHDAETAYLLASVSQRLVIGSGLDPAVLDRIDPQRRLGLDAQAATTSDEQAVALAFAAIERHFPSA
jgi:hypothetical protein